MKLVSVYLRIGGVGRERFRPTCPAPTMLLTPLAPSHKRETAKGGDSGRWWVPGSSLHGDQCSALVSGLSDDEDAAECLPKHGVSRLTCEGTTSELRTSQAASGDASK